MPTLPRLSLLPLVAVATLPLGSCGLLGGDDHLGDALELVPDDASQVVFRDRQAIAERLGVDDVEDGAADDDLQRYAAALSGDATGSDDVLTTFVVAMQDAAFSELDVRWSVEGIVDDGAFTAYRLDDDVDLDAVADDLAGQGYAEDELRGRRHLTLTGEVGELYPSSWIDVTVDPDEHLLVVGTADPVLGVLDDEVSSVGDDDTYDDLLDGIDDVQYLQVSSPPTCQGPAPVTPEQLEASGVADLGSPEAAAYVVAAGDGDGDVDLEARLGFADDDAAEADLDARRTYLADGRLAGTGQPASELGTYDLSRDGSVVRVGLDLDDPADGLAAAQRQDAFLACLPGADDTTG